MRRELQIENAALHLPYAWDDLSDTYFQRKAFLQHTEEYNPCDQRYYLWYRDGELQAGAIAYSLRLDLLTFLRIRSPFRMNIIGIPCSVSSPGIFGKEEAVQTLKQEIYQREKGFCLFLNLPQQMEAPGKVAGETLPTIIFRNPFSTWSDYLEGLRTHYRRRLKRIWQKAKSLQIEQLSCRDFTREMHELYLQVYRQSKDKLEKLDQAFFQHLPSNFKLIVARKADQLLGWVITLEDNDQYYFFLGGIDYRLNRTYNTYFLLLTTIIKDGIEQGADLIDLGQTAEIPKMRLGGYREKRYLEGRHRHPLVQRLLQAGQSWLVYQREVPETHVLKQAYEYSSGTT
ncbi:MAG: GNAT family N-acetyltransferase [Saprospiraceae bacterium]|nr:GNAT family N-acetyltransferase [Lewinella sp.]